MASSRGTITKRTRAKGHVFQARFYDYAGRPRSRTFVQKADAERWLVQSIAQMQRGDLPDPHKGARTFRAYTVEWFEMLNVRPNTRSAYRVILDKHLLPTFGDMPLRNIGTETVRRWHSKMKRSETLNATSVAKCYRLLRQILAVAVEDGYIAKNPCCIKKAGKEELFDPHVPSADEVLRIADAVPLQYRGLVLLAGFGGLRWGEVIALRRKHISIVDAHVQVLEQIVEARGEPMAVGAPKTRAGRRTVYLPAFVMDALVVHLATVGSGPDALLFPAPRPVGAKAQRLGERYLSRANFRKRVWLPAIASAGCPGVRFHDLRHCAATLAATTGATLRELMDHIGHSSPAAAMRYQHATSERRQRIATGINDLVAQTPATVTALRGG